MKPEHSRSFTVAVTVLICLAMTAAPFGGATACAAESCCCMAPSEVTPPSSSPHMAHAKGTSSGMATMSGACQCIPVENTSCHVTARTGAAEVNFAVITKSKVYKIPQIDGFLAALVPQLETPTDSILRSHSLRWPPEPVPKFLQFQTFLC